jgi:hypothetical protein
MGATLETNGRLRRIGRLSAGAVFGEEFIGVDDDEN